MRKLEAYVEEMASPDQISGSVNIQKIQDDVVKLWNVVKSQPEISEEQKNRIKALYDGVVRSLRKAPDSRPRPGVPRSRRSSSQFLRPQISSITSVSADKIPLLHLKRRMGTQWEYSSNLTGVYFDVLHEIATSGTTFKDKNALITGVGKGSIGVEILKGLLSGGAHVVVTTSRYSRATVEYYQGVFQRFGSRGSALTVVPFNQGSKQDVEALVDYIYRPFHMTVSSLANCRMGGMPHDMGSLRISLLAPIVSHSGLLLPQQKLSIMLVELTHMNFTNTYVPLRLERAWALAWVV